MEEREKRPVALSIEGAVGNLRLNRPEQLNALDFELAEALGEGLMQLAEDGRVKAVVIGGVGRSFMAGGDLKVFARDLENAPQSAERLIGLFHSALRSIRRMPKLVIAAAAGPVAGGGLGLAAACDLCVAAEDATFLSAYTRLGTNPDGGTTWLLTQMLGARRALAFMLLNETLDARAAMALGLVNRVVPRDDLDREAVALAQRLADGPAAAQASVKRLVQEAATGSYDAQLDLEKERFVAAAGSTDFREGITAFFERRSAVFGSGA